MGVAVDEGTVVRRRGCSCTKDDFLPEESFQSWGNYGKAWKEVGFRLKDRILTRSLDDTELNEMKARSQHDMKKTLNWWDLIWFGIGAVIGSGIFVLTGKQAKEHVGPAVVISYAISGLSALLSVFCYTEFAVEIPAADEQSPVYYSTNSWSVVLDLARCPSLCGSFAYLRVELGDFVAFVAAGNILFEYVIGGAAVARSWTSYFATLINKNSDFFFIHAPHLAKGYNMLDPLALVVIALICILAVKSTKGSSRLNYIASIFHLIVILFVIIAGFIKGDTKNYTPFTPFGARGIFTASASLFFAYVGFDAVATMAEETKNPGHDIPIGLVGSMVITTTVYCLMAVSLCLMQSYKDIDENAPFSVAFVGVGMGWAKYVVALGALKGMTTVLLVSAIGQARYLTHIARTHMISPWFANVDEKTGTPVNATVVMMVATAIIAFFTDLEILGDLLSISTLFIFMLVAVALLVRRYYLSGETSPGNRNKFLICLAIIVGSSLATAVYWATQGDDWIGYIITVPIWLAATVVLRVIVPQARNPKLWGVPLVPWLPSLSIAVNIFLLGSIAGAAFARFAVWTVILLLYYFFFGLHASYDTAKQSRMEKENHPVEEG
ncbi:hypothetical protein IFM89_021264 [Coptis chinensis]|uniref:Cationic amino acid transporter C-terminal domain-containing protein n=1 Tax=Coptis chinensis TaxID=261450 RepID=A0A835IEE9_9MAGN|nr:hypothetical protein IFM89_021264 [Coptis chinensis]